MVASGESETSSFLSSNSLGMHPYQHPQAPHQVLVVKAPPALLLAPLLAAGKTAVGAVASQGLRGAAMMGAKKVGQMASKQGARNMAMSAASNLMPNNPMETAMEKLREEQQKKEAENRQMQQELMEAGRGGASTASTTMG